LAVQRSSAEAELGEKELEGRKQQIAVLLKNVHPNRATAEEVVVAAREVLASTADLVFANDQATIIEAGHTTYVSVEKLFSNSAGAAKLSPDPKVQKGITDAAGNIAQIHDRTSRSCQTKSL